MNLSGVKPLTLDVRDEKFTLPRVAKFGAPIPTLADLPKTLGRVPISIENQRSTNFCTASTSNASEYQEQVPLSFLFQVAAISRMNGKPILDGADPRTALKAACAYGSLEEKDAPFTIESAVNKYGEDIFEMSASGVTVTKKGWQSVVADPGNWPSETWEKAKKHLKRAYPWVKGLPYDHFDNIRVALFRGKEKNQVVMAFGKWFSSWRIGEDGIVRGKSEGYHSLHHYLFIDFDIIDGKEYIVGQNSYSKNFGHEGLCYFDRETINTTWDGVFYNGTALAMFEDMDEESVTALKEQQLTLLEILTEILQKLLWSFRGVFGSQSPAVMQVLEQLKAALLLLQALLPSLFPPKKEDPVKEPPQDPEVPVVEETMQEIVRRVCKEEKMSLKQSNEIFATVRCESNFNPKAKYENKDKATGKVWSTDWGICQINDYYHIGAGKSFPSVDYVLNNPEACIRWMCKQWKAGRANWWICFARGMHLQYMGGRALSVSHFGTMGEYRKFGSMSSSVDPNKLASTVTGILKAFGAGAALLGFTAVVGDINTLAEQIGQLVLAGYAFYGVAESAFGIARKILVAVHARITS